MNCAGPTSGNWCSIPSFGWSSKRTICRRGFVVGNDRIRTVVADMPDQQSRLAVAERLARDLPGVDAMSEHDRENATGVFSSLTDGLTVRAMMQIRTLTRSQNLPFCPGSPTRFAPTGWASPTTRGARRTCTIESRSGDREIMASVKGQTQAVQQTSSIFSSGPSPGLTAAQASSSGNKPRGILFFAGPTGVGKTELAKAVTPTAVRR